VGTTATGGILGREGSKSRGDRAGRAGQRGKVKEKKKSYRSPSRVNLGGGLEGNNAKVAFSLRTLVLEMKRLSLIQIIGGEG